MAAARPLVTVFTEEGKESKETLALPDVFTCPIRPDLVTLVHTGLNKNKRQAHGVAYNAGHQTAAESWGTGRAVSRIPRAPGGGTHRAGQGAFGNMCRGGRMFAPLQTWRRWHRKVNVGQKRYAVCSSLAGSALPALVMARGHKIDAVPEVPLVVPDAVQAYTKTSKAIALLRSVGAYQDCEKAADSKKIRPGVGKMRNRRYVMRRGPLIIYAKDEGIVKAVRNLPGVDVCHVDRLNLLQLAPGGHIGRFCVWTKSAIARLDALYGTRTSTSELKKGFVLPRSKMTNSDLSRLINSNEVQSHPSLRAAKVGRTYATLKKNPLKNLGAMMKLNPYAGAAKRAQARAEAKATKDRKVNLKAKRKLSSKATKRARIASVAKEGDVPFVQETHGRWLQLRAPGRDTSGDE